MPSYEDSMKIQEAELAGKLRSFSDNALAVFIQSVGSLCYRGYYAFEEHDDVEMVKRIYDQVRVGGIVTDE